MDGCKGCGAPFPSNSGATRKWCAPCRKEARRVAAKKWREANRDLANERTAVWYQENIERERPKAKENARAQRAALTPDEVLGQRLWRYRLERLDFDLMMRQQGGDCAVCRVPFASNEDALIDHDHLCCDKGSCGNCVRGLLCRDCNLALGLLRDDPVKVLRAAVYLRKRGLAFP